MAARTILAIFSTAIFLSSPLLADAPNTPPSSRGEGLTHREYIIPDGFFLPFEKNGNAAQQLIGRGAHFSPGTSASYQASAHNLIVVNSYEETVLIGKMIENWKATHFK